MLVASQIANVHSDLATMRDEARASRTSIEKRLDAIEAKIPSSLEKKAVLAIFALLAAKILGLDVASVVSLLH